ncbi:MAG: MYXO-CTERM sorting domain-containing protein [Polyangiaceae bacterium]
MRNAPPVAVAALLVTLWARGAAADGGRFPMVYGIAFSPANENVIVAQATYAILPSNDDGTTWGYLCESVLALPESDSYEDPELRLTANALVAGLDAPNVGLDVSSDLGCNWGCIGGPLASQQIVDVEVRPDAPHQVLALTSTYGADAEAGISSQVFQSTDDGATWAALGTPIDPTVSVTTVGVPNGDPMRIYVAGTRNYDTARTASLFVSTDAGATWVEHPVPQFNPSIPCVDTPPTQCPSEGSLFIAGVDPTDENRVYLRSNGLADTDTLGDTRLYVTTDGGQTFQVAMTFQLPNVQTTDFIASGEALAFALTPDGSKVYVGTIENGLWSASRTDLTFAQVNPRIHVQCLAARQAMTGPELWACSDEISGFVIGKSTDDGATFKAMMPTLTSLSGPIACSPEGQTSAACFTDANASACSCPVYQTFCTETESDNACLGCGFDAAAPPVGDAGDSGTEGGVEREAPASARSSSGCGCSAAGGGGAAGFAALWAVAATVLRRRRRGRS